MKNIATSTQDVNKIYVDGTYLYNNATWHVEESPWKAEQILKIFTKNNISPQKICEVGCGAGEILRQLSLKMPSTNFFGYELSPQAFELCSTRESERLHYMLKNILDEDVFFDGLLCIDVFEHVDDYIGFLKALKSKATFKVFHIPLDISVYGVLRGSMMSNRKSVGHIHYFTPETAIATLKDSGYDIVDYFYTTSFNDLPSKTLRARLAKFPQRLLYSISPNLMVKLIGGCSLLVLAK